MKKQIINLKILSQILKEYGIPCFYIHDQVYDLDYESDGIRIDYRGFPILVTIESSTNTMFVEARESNLAKEFRFSIMPIILREFDTELFIIELLQRALYRTYCRIEKHIQGE